jgi:hypothetical protein
MIEGVEGLEAQLELGPLGGMEVFENSQIQLVHTAGAHIAPAGGIVANVGGEILIDTVLGAVAGRWNVAVAGQVLNSRPGRNTRDRCVLGWEREKLAGVEPLIQ